jgi:acetolactate synthase-1/2/3 large subunit
MLEAYSSRSPVLQVTSQISLTVLGLDKGALHETKEQGRMLGTVADIVHLWRSAGDVPHALQAAVAHLRRPGAGPAAVSIPVDPQTAPLKGDAGGTAPVAPEAPQPASATLYDRAATVLAQAAFPVIPLGGGTIAAATPADIRAQVIALAESLSAPILVTTESRGVVPEDHPLVLGAVLQERALDPLIARCDAILAIGTRFRALATREWAVRIPAQLVQVDVDRGALGRNYPAAVGFVDAAANAVRELATRLAGAAGAGVRPEATDAVAAARARVREAVKGQGPTYLRLADTIRAALPRDAVLVADATVIAYQVFNRVLPFYEPRSHLFPSSYAIGPSLPLALGAKLGAPTRTVVQVAGDGGFMLNLSELVTAAEYRVPVVSVVLNNRGYGVLRMLQATRYEGRFIGVDLQPPDFVAVARARGGDGTRVGSHDAFREALDGALAAERPFLVEVDVKGLQG